MTSSASCDAALQTAERDRLERENGQLRAQAAAAQAAADAADARAKAAEQCCPFSLGRAACRFWLLVFCVAAAVATQAGRTCSPPAPAAAPGI